MWGNAFGKWRDGKQSGEASERFSEEDASDGGAAEDDDDAGGESDDAAGAPPPGGVAGASEAVAVVSSESSGAEAKADDATGEDDAAEAGGDDAHAAVENEAGDGGARLTNEEVLEATIEATAEQSAPASGPAAAAMKTTTTRGAEVAEASDENASPFSKAKAWISSFPAKAKSKHLDAVTEAAAADPTNFVKQDTLMRELVAAERWEECVARFEARNVASGPGSVVAYLTALGKLDRLHELDTKMPPPAQLSMAAAAVMKDKKLTTEEATEAVAEAVAVAAADRSELPALLRDLSKRAEGREDVVRLPPGRTPASPLYVAVGDGYGGTLGGGGSQGQAKGGGLINFIFYSVVALLVGSASMGMMKKYASSVVDKGKSASSSAASSSSGASGSSSAAGGASGLLPGGGGGSKLPVLGGGGKAEDKKEGSSFDPKEYNKEALPEKSVKTFDDVKGCDEAKQELQEIVEYLKNPDRFTRLGGKLPKGVLLSGPPGTGKTLLARAVAGEAGVPFFYRAGSEFEEMFVGVGSKRVRQLFSAAKKKTPCIVFIDEIDAVGTSRKAFETQSRKTLNQLLTEMDGFEQNEGIIVIAATNIPEQLDPALTRPGRFDRLIHVPNPDIGGRREILTHYLADKPCDPDVDIESLARGTAGFSGAELFNLVNVAAVQAAVSNEMTISAARLEWAKDRVVMGVERKSAVLTEESKRLTAYHEAGHAVVALRTGGAMPVHKATIVPRGSALGMVTQLPDKDETSITRKQLLARLDVCMGGRVAEELIFGRDEVTTGALSDLQQATRLATYMVGEVGLSNLVGPVHVDSMSKGGRRATEALVDREVVQLLRDSHARVTRLLTKHSADLHKLSAELLQKETMTGDEIRALLGMKPAAKPTPPPSKKKEVDVVDAAGAAKEGGATAAGGEGEAGGDDVRIPDIDIGSVEPVEAKEDTAVDAKEKTTA